MNQSIIRLLLLGFCFLVGVSFLFAYLTDPLGMAPVLDARENLALAEGMARGEWPVSPFYRAVLYPFLLSLPLRFGLEETLPWLASVLGLGFHFLNAFLTGRLAGTLWRSNEAAWVAGVLYACYPVALFFSVQVLDITPGITLFLLVLNLLVAHHHRRRALGWFGIGIVMGLTVAVRPNFLSVAPIVLVVPLLTDGKCRRVSRFMAVAAGVALPLLTQGATNYLRSGDFRILPWQGSFNLYAANRAGADGRYFEQRVLFKETAPGDNTARRESEYLYRQSVGAEAPLEPSAINHFWRQQLIKEIGSDPLGWLGLLGRKTFYLFHNWEPYNNLSYSYHRERFAVLAWNPLSWTFIVSTAAAGLLLAFPSMNRRRAAILLSAGCCYAIGVIAFYVSARFRLPLVPLLVIGSAGWAVVIEQWMNGRLPSAGKWIGALAVSFCLVIVSLVDWANSYDERPFVQDEILLASAALQVGDGDMAYETALSARERSPDHPIAARLIVGSVLLGTSNGIPPTSDEIAEVRDALTIIEPVDGPMAVVAGLLSWFDGNAERALILWREADSPLGEALAAAGVEAGVGMHSGAISSDPVRLLLSAWRPQASVDRNDP